MMTGQVQQEIGEFVLANWDSFISDAAEYDGLDITVAINEAGDLWNYQTGDNSYTGGCYGLPIWAVTTITVDSDVRDVCDEIFYQLEDAL